MLLRSVSAPSSRFAVSVLMSAAALSAAALLCIVAGHVAIASRASGAVCLGRKSRNLPYGAPQRPHAIASTQNGSGSESTSNFSAPGWRV